MHYTRYIPLSKRFWKANTASLVNFDTTKIPITCVCSRSYDRDNQRAKRTSRRNCCADDRTSRDRNELDHTGEKTSVLPLGDGTSTSMISGFLISDFLRSRTMPFSTMLTVVVAGKRRKAENRSIDLVGREGRNAWRQARSFHTGLKSTVRRRCSFVNVRHCTEVTLTLLETQPNSRHLTGKHLARVRQLDHAVVTPPAPSVVSSHARSYAFPESHLRALARRTRERERRNGGNRRCGGRNRSCSRIIASAIFPSKARGTQKSLNSTRRNQ